MNDNKTLVSTFLKALGTGDTERLMTLLTEDFTAVATGTAIVSGTRRREELLGAAQMLKTQTKNGVDFRVLNLTAEADRVAAEVEGYTTFANGTAYNNQYHFLFFIRSGKITKMKEYFDTKLADAVLGASMAAEAK
jgi:uncharacterized protein